MTTEELNALIAQAKGGSVEAAIQLNAIAWEYQYGNNGRTIDLQMAYQLYTIAAECGNIDARATRAYCLYHGIGVEKDPQQSFQLFEQLANEGAQMGLSNLGWFYLGNSIEKDLQKAIYWFTRAAEEYGNIFSMKNLTHIYGEEEGFINYEQAAKWFLELIKRDCDPNSGVYENTGYNKDLYEKIKDNVQYSITEEDVSNLEKAKALLREKTLILFRQGFINGIQIIRDNLLNELKDIPFTPGDDFDSTVEAQKKYLVNVINNGKELVKQGVSNVGKNIQSAIIKGFSYIGTYIQANLPTPLREIPFTPGVDDMQSAVQAVQDYIQRVNSKTKDIVKDNSSMLGYALFFTTSNAKSYINQAEEAIQRNIAYKEEQRRKAEECARREREERERREREEKERQEREKRAEEERAARERREREERERRDREEKERQERERREREKKEKRDQAFIVKVQKDYDDYDEDIEEIPCTWEEEEMEVIVDENIVVYEFNAFDKVYKRTLIIPESVSHIGNNVFVLCECFHAVHLPNSLISIGKSAFRASCLCGDVIIPSGVKSIGEKAFCESEITSITIPDSVTYVGKDAFADLKYLKTIEFPNGVVKIVRQGSGFGSYIRKILVPKAVKQRFLNIFGDYCVYDLNKGRIKWSSLIEEK